MMKCAFSKVMTVGRVTVYLVGLAVMLARVAPRTVEKQELRKGQL